VVSRRGRCARAKVFTLDKLHHQRALFEAVDLRDVQMIERRQRARLALEAHQAIGIGGKGVGQSLDRDVASKSSIAGAINLTHASCTERRHDFIDTNARARGKRHEGVIIAVSSAVRRQLSASPPFLSRVINERCTRRHIAKRAGSIHLRIEACLIGKIDPRHESSPS
jgi:hypothetical protein